MQKLTKEQADWLIEQLRNQSFDLYGIHLNSRESGKGFSYELVQDFINQCTEKEFPACSFETQQHRIISLHQCVDKAVLNQEFFLEKEELKKLVFILGRAIEWMEEQECKN